MNPSRLAAFSDAYLSGLAEAMESHPEDYASHLVCAVLHGKMMKAVVAGTYNHDGRGFANACRALGIRHTRKAIRAFLEGA